MKVDVKDCATSAEAMEALGNPRYSKTDCLYRPRGEDTPYDFPKRKVILSPDGLPIATVGAGYEIFQPVHGLETAYNVAEAVKGKVTEFHFLKDMRRYLVDVTLPGGYNVGAKEDRIEAHAWIYNPCDGGGSLTFGLTAKRFFCQNQLSAFVKAASVSVQHRRLVHGRFQAAIQAAGFILNRLPDMVESMSAMTEAKMTDQEAIQFFDKLVPGEATRSENVKADMLRRFSYGMGAEVYPETRWNAYNAVTEYLTHEVAHKKNGMDRIMAGSGLRMDIRAFEMLAA